MDIAADVVILSLPSRSYVPSMFRTRRQFFYTATKQTLDSEDENHPASGEAFAEVNLCCPETTVLENERDFDHPTFHTLASVQDFFLKRITSGNCQRPVNLGKLAHPVTAKAATVVFIRQSEAQPGPEIDLLTHQFSPGRPACDAATANIAGGNGDVTL